jgi:hypothetical protein
LNYSKIEIIDKLLSIIVTGNIQTYILIIASTLKNSGLSEEEAKEIFVRWFGDVYETEWNECCSRGYSSIGCLYLAAREVSPYLYADFIRELSTFSQPGGYTWSDFLSELKHINIPSTERFEGKVILCEAAGELEEWVVPRLASCIRFVNGTSRLVIVKTDNESAYCIDSASKFLLNYASRKYPTIKGTPKEWKIVDKSVLSLYQDRDELEHSTITWIPHCKHLPQPSMHSNALNLFPGIKAKVIDGLEYPKDQDFSTVDSFNNPDNPFYEAYPILYHMCYVLVDGNMVDFKYIFNWNANVARHPDILSEVGLALVGKPGCGKSIFFELLSLMLYGSELACTADLNQITQKFNTIFLNKLLVVLNETSGLSDLKHRNITFDKMKSLLTDRRQAVEHKGKDLITNTIIYFNCVILSNRECCIKVEQDDRRYAMFKCSDRHIGDAAYFERLAAAFTPRAMDLLFTMFYNPPEEWRMDKLGGKNIPRTKLREKAMETSKSNIEAVIDDILDGTTPLSTSNFLIREVNNEKHMFIPSVELHNLYIQWMVENNPDKKRLGKKSMRTAVEDNMDKIYYVGNVTIDKKSYRGYQVSNDHRKQIKINTKKCSCRDQTDCIHPVKQAITFDEYCNV